MVVDSPSVGVCDLSVVVPIYNEIGSVDPLVERGRGALEPMGLSWELLAVDDGSTDGTGERLDELAAADERIKVLHFVANSGQSAGLDAGFKHARGRLIALLDAGFTGHVVHLDLSPQMQRRARARLRRRRPDALDRVEWLEASIDELSSVSRFDLICTHFVLDQFAPHELSDVVSRLARAASAGARWHDVDFAEPEQGRRLRAMQRVLLSGLYAAFGRLCGLAPRSIPPIDGAIRAAGFQVLDRAPGARGLLRSTLYRDGGERA